MERRRVLLVDDDPSILLSGAAILRQNGYDVTAVATVADALNAIASEKFHILVSDLNVGQPGDGFTVVSALRRTHSDAIALIVTGYPAFEQALQSIREQVDDFLLKPVHPADLVDAIRALSNSRREHVALQSKRIVDVIRGDKNALVQRMLGKLRGLVIPSRTSTCRPSSNSTGATSFHEIRSSRDADVPAAGALPIALGPCSICKKSGQNSLENAAVCKPSRRRSPGPARVVEPVST